MKVAIEKESEESDHIPITQAEEDFLLGLEKVRDNQEDSDDETAEMITESYTVN